MFELILDPSRKVLEIRVQVLGERCWEQIRVVYICLYDPVRINVHVDQLHAK